MSVGHHVWHVLLFIVCKTDRECECAFLCGCSGSFRDKVCQASGAMLPDLQDEVSQCGVGFLLGQEVQGLVTQSTAVSVPGLLLCRLTSVTFSVSNLNSILRVDSNPSRGFFPFLCVL